MDEGKPPVDTGELTYLFYKTCSEYLGKRRECYQVHAEILGALTATRAEWYRRQVAPYEDQKIAEHGDIN